MSEHSKRANIVGTHSVHVSARHRQQLAAWQLARRTATEAPTSSSVAIPLSRVPSKRFTLPIVRSPSLATDSDNDGGRSSPKLLVSQPVAGCLTPTEEKPPSMSRKRKLESSTVIGEYTLLSGHTKAQLLAGESCIVIDASCTRKKTIKLLTAVEHERYTKLLHRLSTSRHLWAEHSDDGHLDYDRLSTSVLTIGAHVVSDAHGRYYFVEPVSEHGSLHTHIQENKHLSEIDAQRLFRDLIAILAFCHTLGIMVRDLKLRKLVFTCADRRSLRLCSPLDVHVCADIGDDTLSDRHGCPAYVSPEIVSVTQRTFSGSASDMWSAGVLLYVMLVGRYPFYDTTATGLFEKIRRGEFCVPANLQFTLDARLVMSSLLRLDAAARPTAISLLRAPWMQSGAVAAIRSLAPPPAGVRGRVDARRDDQVVPVV